MAIERSRNTGDAKEMMQTLHEALRAHRYPCAPVRVVEIPQPNGGPRPRGSATVEERVVQTAMPLVLEPILDADCHACSYGDRPKRDAKPAARAMRADRYHRAWGVVAMACQAYCPSIPHRQLLTLSTRRIADGSLLTLSKQTLTVGAYVQGQGGPTQGGGPQGAPLSPWSSHSSLHLGDHLWHSRGSPAKRGATLHRYADDAILVCRRSPQPVLAACAGIAKRRAWTINRDKTRVTRGTAGGDWSDCTCVQRKSPRSGKQAMDIFPAPSAQQTMRNRLQYVTSRRAPIRPKDCGDMVHPMVTGGVHYVRHTHARPAFRGLQRFVNIRLRRSLSQRSTGRGVGGQRVPHRTL